MKIFYGGTFINKIKLKEANIYNPIKLEYYKLENEENKQEQYGIEVIKTEYTKEKVLVETEKLEGITHDEKIVDKVLELFKRNEVTPISANEIVHDFLTSNKC